MKRFNLTNRILSLVIPVITLCTFLICISSGISGHMRTRQETLTTFERIANSAKMVVEGQIDSMVYSVSELGNYVDICSKTMTSDELNNYLAEKAKLNNFQTLYITNKNGITNKGWDMSSYDFFKSAISGNTFLTSPQITEDGGSAAMTVSAPIWKDGIEDGEVVGIVCAVVDAKYISDLLGQIDVGETGTVYIIDNEGYTIADPNYDYVLSHENTILSSQSDEDLIAFAEVEKAALNGQVKTGRVKYEGDTTLVSVIPIEKYGWAVGAYADSWEYMKGNITNSYLTSVFGAIFIIISSIAIFFFIKKVISPLGEMADIITKVSKGDYNVSVNYSRNDEIGDMAKAVNNMVNSNNACIKDISGVLTSMSQGDFTVKTNVEYVGVFKEIENALSNIINSLSIMVKNVRNASENVSEGADQVASGATELSQGATEQASAVQELAATVEDLSRNVTKTADNASMVADITNGAHDEVNNSNEQMKNLMSAMDKINTTSSDIVKIVKSIEDIAFQTNLLALNASVEAARAGSAGKGFAVVATEVKNLASKAAEASKETAGLIEQAMEAISEGTKCANSTFDALNNVVNNMNEVDNKIKSIEEDMNNQAEALSQIAISVEQISVVTQSNSATSEQSAAASEVLAHQASQLNDIVNKFKV